MTKVVVICSDGMYSSHNGDLINSLIWMNYIDDLLFLT